LAGSRAEEPSPTSLEQWGAEALLQAQEALAERRLAHVEVRCSCGQRLVLVERFEEFEVPKIQIHIHKHSLEV
jgi:hypothetical protein